MAQRKLIDIAAFRAEAKAGGKPEAGVFRMSAEEAVVATDGSRKIRFCFSDATVDRAGDSIAADGWQIDGFMKNPVALWAHESSEPPIGRASNVGPTGGKFMGDIEFMPSDMSPFADSIYRMVKGKFINAVSVGFLPIEWSFVNDKDRPFGMEFKKQELLEISVCPVPCNPNALIEARAKGIDTAPLREWAEKLLDGDGRVWIPRTLLAETFKLAKTPGSTRRKYLPPKAGTKAEGEGIDSAGGEVISPEPDAASDGLPPGNCGRKADETCGMKDPLECAMHFKGPGPTDVEGSSIGDLGQVKAGRRISSKNVDKLKQARTHIDDVLSSNSDDDTPDDSEDVTDPIVDPDVDTRQVDPREDAKKRLALLN